LDGAGGGDVGGVGGAPRGACAAFGGEFLGGLSEALGGGGFGRAAGSGVLSGGGHSRVLLRFGLRLPATACIGGFGL